MVTTHAHKMACGGNGSSGALVQYRAMVVHALGIVTVKDRMEVELIVWEAPLRFNHA